MKPTIRVSIGGLAFNLEEDAYNVLNNYLQALRRHFMGNIEADEIIADIESRLSELLQMRVNGNDGVVSITDAQEITKIMGNPKDFDSTSSEDVEDGSQRVGNAYKINNTNGYTQDSFKKGLFRDKNNKILGGVCSGLGHYFRVDIVAIRLIFVGLFFLLFFALHKVPACMFMVLFYVILWIVMPVAQTFKQKLSMAGADPSIENIEDRTQAEPRKYRGSGAGTFVKVILNIIVGFAAAITCIVLLSMIVGFVWLCFDTEILDIDNYLILLGYNTINIKIAFLLVSFIPVASLFWLFVKILRRSSFTSQTMISFIVGLIVWLGALFYLGNKGVETAVRHQNYAEVVETIPVINQADTLVVKLGAEYKNAIAQPITPFLLYDGKGGSNRRLFILPTIKVEEDSLLTDCSIEVRKVAYGRSESEARNQAESLRLDYVLNNSEFEINPHWYDTSNSWHSEVFHILIKTPRNKHVLFESPLKEGYYSLRFNNHRYNYNWRYHSDWND